MANQKRVVVLTLLLYLTGVLLFGWHDWRSVKPASSRQPAAVAARPAAPRPAAALPAVVSLGATAVHAAPSADQPVGLRSAHILMYHYVRGGVDPQKDKIGYGLSVSPAQFESEVQFLHENGYSGVSMADLAAGKGGPKAVALTFDDGYEDFYTAAWPILQKYGWKATVYIITGKIGGNYMTWEQLAQLKAAGVEIGAHTVDHLDLSRLSADRQREEIFGSQQALQAHLGGPVTAFCYPSGKYNAETLVLVKEAGFTTATTTKPGTVTPESDPLQLPRLRMAPGLSLATLRDELAR